MTNREIDDISVVIVEDHPIFRDALRGYIQAVADGIVLLGEAETAVHALELVEQTAPDIVLLDLELRDATPEDGLGLINLIKETSPNTKVVVITGYQDYVFPAIRFGATSYLLKRNVQPHDVRRIIHQAHAGEAPLDPEVAKRLWDYFQNESPPTEGAKSPWQRLTKREHEVLELVAQRRSNPEIADQLCISVKTAKTHISNILAKLHLRNREQLRMMVLTKQPSMGDQAVRRPD